MTDNDQPRDLLGRRPERPSDGTTPIADYECASRAVELDPGARSLRARLEPGWASAATKCVRWRGLRLGAPRRLPGPPLPPSEWWDAGAGIVICRREGDLVAIDTFGGGELWSRPTTSGASHGFDCVSAGRWGVQVVEEDAMVVLDRWSGRVFASVTLPWPSELVRSLESVEGLAVMEVGAAQVPLALQRCPFEVVVLALPELPSSGEGSDRWLDDYPPRCAWRVRDRILCDVPEGAVCFDLVGRRCWSRTGLWPRGRTADAFLCGGDDDLVYRVDPADGEPDVATPMPVPLCRGGAHWPVVAPGVDGSLVVLDHEAHGGQVARAIGRTWLDERWRLDADDFALEPDCVVALRGEGNELVVERRSLEDADLLESVRLPAVAAAPQRGPHLMLTAGRALIATGEGLFVLDGASRASLHPRQP